MWTCEKLYFKILWLVFIILNQVASINQSDIYTSFILMMQKNEWMWNEHWRCVLWRRRAWTRICFRAASRQRWKQKLWYLLRKLLKCFTRYETPVWALFPCPVYRKVAYHETELPHVSFPIAWEIYIAKPAGCAPLEALFLRIFFLDADRHYQLRLFQWCRKQPNSYSSNPVCLAFAIGIKEMIVYVWKWHTYLRGISNHSMYSPPNCFNSSRTWQEEIGSRLSLRVSGQSPGTRQTVDRSACWQHSARVSCTGKLQIKSAKKKRAEGTAAAPAVVIVCLRNAGSRGFYSALREGRFAKSTVLKGAPFWTRYAHCVARVARWFKRGRSW